MVDVDDFPRLQELWSHADGRSVWTTRSIAEVLYAGSFVGLALNPGMPDDLLEYQAELLEELERVNACTESVSASEAADLFDVLFGAHVDAEPMSMAFDGMVLISMAQHACRVTFAELALAARDQALVEVRRKEEHARRVPADAEELRREAAELRAEARDWAHIAARYSI